MRRRFGEVDAVVELLDSRVVIPMHYLIHCLTDPDSTLETADSWVETQGKVARIAGEEMRVSPESLSETREIWLFEGYAKN